MTLWKISVYQEKQDDKPIREGYLSASSEDEAAALAKTAMGAANRADLIIKANTVLSLPTGEVLWV